jgi:hypothetical protein
MKTYIPFKYFKKYLEQTAVIFRLICFVSTFHGSHGWEIACGPGSLLLAELRECAANENM